MAAELLSAGFLRGMVSEQVRGHWPQNVWTVADTGQVYEAQLENQLAGGWRVSWISRTDRG